MGRRAYCQIEDGVLNALPNDLKEFLGSASYDDMRGSFWGLVIWHAYQNRTEANKLTATEIAQKAHAGSPPYHEVSPQKVGKFLKDPDQISDALHRVQNFQNHHGGNNNSYATLQGLSTAGRQSLTSNRAFPATALEGLRPLETSYLEIGQAIPRGNNPVLDTTLREAIQGITRAVQQQVTAVEQAVVPKLEQVASLPVAVTRHLVMQDENSLDSLKQAYVEAPQVKAVGQKAKACWQAVRATTPMGKIEQVFKKTRDAVQTIAVQTEQTWDVVQVVTGMTRVVQGEEAHRTLQEQVAQRWLEQSDQGNVA